MNIALLQSVSEGWDPELVEACGPELLHELYESAASNAAKELIRGKDAHLAKEKMKTAKKLIRTDPKEALKLYDEAIALFEKLSDRAQEIPDDLPNDVFWKTFAKYMISMTVGMVAGAGIGAAAGAIWSSLGVAVGSSAGLSVGYLAGLIYGIIWGDKEANNATKVISAGKTKRTLADKEHQVGQAGITRANVVDRFDKTIALCKRARRSLEKKLEVTE